MPELPDVEHYRHLLEKEGLNKRVKQIYVRKKQVVDLSPTTLQRHLKDHPLTQARRHGKWLFAHIGNEAEWLAMHFGMTGRLEPYDTAGHESPKYTVLDIKLENGEGLAVTSKRLLGRIDLTESPEKFAEEHHLGPDAQNIAPEDFLERLQQRKGAIKSALMDQHLIAGIGNVYADEALFHARIDPHRDVQDLHERDLRRLHSKIQHVIDRAVEAEAQPEQMPRGWLVPLRREKDPHCPRCGHRLKREKVSGRTTLWCPWETK